MACLLCGKKRKKKEKLGEPKALPREFSLEEKLPPIWYDQKHINSCVGEAIAFVLSYHYYQQYRKPLKFSSLYIYWHARYLIKRHLSDEGAYIHDGITAVSRWGSPTYERWSTTDTLLFVQPSPEAYEEAFKLKPTRINAYVVDDYTEAKKAIYAGYPVIFGFYVPESFHRQKPQNKEVILDIPPPSERIAGGHAVVGIGYSDIKEAILCRNSWGDKWGTNGNFWIKYSYLESDKGLISQFFVIIPEWSK